MSGVINNTSNNNNTSANASLFLGRPGVVDERWATDSCATFIARIGGGALRVHLHVVGDAAFSSWMPGAEAEFAGLSAGAAELREL